MWDASWRGGLEWVITVQCFPTVQRNILHLLGVSVEPLHSSQADRLEEVVTCRIIIKKKKKNPFQKTHQKCETGISSFCCYVMARDSGSLNTVHVFLAQPCLFLPNWTFLQICHCIHAPETMKQINTLFPIEGKLIPGCRLNIAGHEWMGLNVFNREDKLKNWLRTLCTKYYILILLFSNKK